MKYGSFSKDNMEYIITNPSTPRPWINYLYNKSYCAIISHTGGGYSFYKDCKTNRLTRWRPEQLYTDRPGRYVFLRDNDTSDYWSPNWQPLCKEGQDFECRHGLGYTTILATVNDIYVEITYFVPRHYPAEIWKVTLRNKSNNKRNLSVFPLVELALGDFHMELLFRNISSLFNKTYYDEKLNAIIGKKGTWGWSRQYPYQSFFASSLDVDGYDCVKERFFGKYEIYDRPNVLVKGRCTNSHCSGENSVCVLQHNITLQPGEEMKFSIMFGLTKSDDEANAIIDKYSDLDEVDAELDAIKKFWSNVVNTIRVKTPDHYFDRLVNVWLKYQLYTTNYWSRSPSFYHEGTGGRGYRDSCQDAESITSLDSEYTKKKLEDIAGMHFKNGQTAPGWSDDYGAFDSPRISDHPVWYCFTLSSYVKETGDYDFLNKVVSYMDGGAGTMLDHAVRNLNYIYSNRGKHGLPYIGHADWNDAIDAADPQAESVWLGIALVRGSKTMAKLAEAIGNDELKQDMLKKAENMTKIINENAWDGEWYLRMFTKHDESIGSSKCKEGKVFLNPQSWAILAGVCEGERKRKVLRTIDEKLDSEYGPVLLSPAYTHPNESIGRITKFSPGTKENAAVFCHAVAFKIAVDCLEKRGDKGYTSLRAIMPNNKEYEHYKAEPYVFAEFLVGPDHPYLFGEGAFTWLTGAAGWIFMIATEWMLGARKEFGGLLIDPCIPSSWPKCRIVRPFRGAVYDIKIENPDRVCSGIKEMYVDEKRAKGNLIKPHGDGQVHKVRVVLG